MSSSPFRYFKTSPEIVRLAVKLYVRFPLSLERARHLRAWPQWRWHLDEVFVRINGKVHYLWRAVDQQGEVLEAYVTRSRNRKAVLKFLRKVMKRYDRPANNRHRQASLLPGSPTKDRQRCAPADRPLAEQSGGKLARTVNAALSADENTSEIRSNSFIRAQPFQSGAPSLQLPNFQAEPCRRSRRVARAQCRIIVRRSSANVGACQLF